MKEFVISEAKVETAILVGLITQTQDERKTTEYLDELEFLAHTAGAKVVRRFTQKLPCAHSVTYVGKGKLEEIRDYIRAEEEEEREIGMVIFDDELSAKQLRNIEAELKVKIFNDYSVEWARFILRNRNIKEPLPVHDYDIVYGPVANDHVYTAFALYEGNVISKQVLIAELRTYTLVDQYLFHTERSLESLKFIEANEVKI